MCSQVESQFGQDKLCFPSKPKSPHNELNLNRCSEYWVRLGEISGLGNPGLILGERV
jgi:hypothetical protein